MISEEERRNIIEGIPEEGALSYEAPDSSLNTRSRRFAFTQERAEEIVSKFFEGKTPVEPGERKKANIVFGTPGSGKTTCAREIYNDLDNADRDSTIFVGYSEAGALYAIDEYVEALKEHFPDYQTDFDYLDDMPWPEERDSVKMRRELHGFYRPLSERVRHLTFKRALDEGYNVILDIDGAHKDDDKVITDVLRPLDYDVHSMAIVGSFPLARMRSTARLRPLHETNFIFNRVGDPFDESNTHVGVLHMIEPFMKASDTFECYSNYGYQLYHGFRYDTDFKLAITKDSEGIEVHEDNICGIRSTARSDIDCAVEYMFEIMMDDEQYDERLFDAYSEFQSALDRIDKEAGLEPRTSWDSSLFAGPSYY